MYTLNRTGRSSVEDKSSFVLSHGKGPNLDHLRVFGTEVFMHVPSKKSQKLDNKSKKGIFVEYQENTHDLCGFMDSRKSKLTEMLFLMMRKVRSSLSLLKFLATCY